MSEARDAITEQQVNCQSCSVLNADIAMLLCLELWGFPEPASSNRSPLSWLDSDWSGRLHDAGRQLGSQTAERALELLRRSHRFQRQADPAHVHSTWWIRAARRISGRQTLRLATRARAGACSSECGIGSRTGSLETPERDLAVADWVLSLAGERLVGGEPVSRDEPPAIVALAALSSRELYCLVHATGQAKTVLAEDPQDLVAGRHLDDVRKQWFQAYFLDRFGDQETRLKTGPPAISRNLQAPRVWASGGGLRSWD